MRTFFTSAGVLALTSLAASALMPVKPAVADEQLTIVSWGGSLQMSERKAYFEPFSKATGIKVTEDQYSGEIAKVRTMVESKAVSWDVVDSSGRQAIQMCADGLVETIDWKRLGLDRTKFMTGDQQDCGVPSLASATVIAYDKDRLANGPKTIADLFDTKKFPGTRGLNKTPVGNLEWTLVADGVPIKDVYKLLRTPEGVDRAFKKLDTIKKDVVWWTSGAQPPQLLADGQVIMTSVWNGRINDAVKNSGKHFEIMWDAEQLSWNAWVIPKGTPRLDSAYKFIAFAGSPQAQADLTQYIPYAPGNKEATALIDTAILPHVPTAPEHMANAQPMDNAFWAEKGDELNQRFTAWLAK